MPRVGNERFPYTRSGQKAARRRARETGQSVSNSGGGYGGGSRSQGGKMNPYAPIPGRPGRVPKGRFGPKPRSLPPPSAPGRSAGPSKRGLPVGPGMNNAIQRPKGWWTGEAGPGGVPGSQLPYPGKTGINPPSPVPPGPPGYGGATIPPRPPGFSKGPGLAPPRTDNRGGSRVMKNPGLSGRPSGKMPGVGPGRRQRRKGGIGGGY